MIRSTWNRPIAVGFSVSMVLGLVGSSPASAQTPELDCLIQPGEIVTVSAPVDGVVERIHVERGTTVKKGGVLAVLESSAEHAAVAVAKARAEGESALESTQVRVDFGNRRFVRTDEMFRKNLIPLKELDEAETAKVLAELAVKEVKEANRIAKLEYERAKALLELRTITSPINGVVVERLRSAGELTDRDRPLVKIAQLDPLRVEVVVPLALYGRIAVGQRVQVTPEAPLNLQREAVVTAVGPVADAASGTFVVRLELRNPQHRIPGGLKCQARFPAVSASEKVTAPVATAPAEKPAAAVPVSVPRK